MNEEIEYAEMLEIPVSTVNVVRKKRSKKRKSEQREKTPSVPIPELKDTVIAQVNDKVQATPSPVTADPEQFAESANSDGKVNFEDVPDRIDTVRLYAEGEHPFFDETPPLPDDNFSMEDYENDGGKYVTNKKTRMARLVLGAEFALACALCGTIFLTNVFMPESAMNTFFRALHSPAQVAQTDERGYADFTLSSVVSEFSNAELALSPTGILTFTEKCCVYPTADGKINAVTQNADGTYTVKISHSDTFTGVISGLNSVYYNVDDAVKANVPVGYSEGETEVQVTMYSGGTLLNCFELTEENCLAWVVQE